MGLGIPIDRWLRGRLEGVHRVSSGQKKRLLEQGIPIPTPSAKMETSISPAHVFGTITSECTLFQAWLDHAQQDLSYFG